ncbi:hypothetical protein KPL78_24125 [Roseomonas sp. HJA6]|uniref:Uncharacterized protein n=1 Tax=Roseomonas alba TaxID=2846776 RepID=A0ABS7AF90_9PROT|nr:hypothetical protein [Neoroseomonas alba]MBW6400968.1 hypothetical protein [Neoroseomonas alba]
MVDDDATVRLERPGTALPPGPPPALQTGGGRLVILAAASGVLLAAGAGAWFWLGRDTSPTEPPPKPDTVALAPQASVASLPAPTPTPGPVITTPRVAPPAALSIAIATEETIRDHRGAEPTMFRLVENPHVFVSDFPNLDQQGAALNRAAALIEKAGAPRDRVLDDAALASTIARAGETPATYYYGHNYRGRDLERFFDLAARDGVRLTPEETWLHDQVARIRTLLPAGTEFAVISVPGVDSRVDESMRAAILHHEIGHGHFFTNPAFAAHVERVWREVFTEAERAHFRAFLQREGYDPGIEEVMLNEAMAYLIYTPDARFFTPAHAGLDDARADALRAALREGAPR